MYELMFQKVRSCEVRFMNASSSLQGIVRPPMR